MFRISWNTFGGKTTQKYLFTCPTANRLVKLTSCWGFFWILILLEMDGNNKCNVNYTQICTYSRGVVSFTLGRGWKYTKKSQNAVAAFVFPDYTLCRRQRKINPLSLSTAGVGDFQWEQFAPSVICRPELMCAWVQPLPHPHSSQEKKTSFRGVHRRNHIKVKVGGGASKEGPHIWSDWRGVCGGPQINERPEF